MKEAQYKISSGDIAFDLNVGAIEGLDVVNTDGKEYHILINNTSYKAEILNFDFNAKSLTISINGNKYPILIQDHFDVLVDKMGLSAASSQLVKDITAPMPGLVLEIEVEAAQSVQKGDPLLILEAMKMENVLKSPGDGIIKNIIVSKGDAVEKGQILIELE